MFYRLVFEEKIELLITVWIHRTDRFDIETGLAHETYLANQEVERVSDGCDVNQTHGLRILVVG